MPNIKSKSKHLRKSKKRQLYNRVFKARLKTMTNKILVLLEDQKIEEASVELNNFYKVADKASIKGVLKKNTVARKKSNLAKKVNASNQTAPVES